MRTPRTLSIICGTIATIGASAQNTYDSRIDSYVGLRYSCDGSVQPTLRIQNVGTETMTSCDIDVLKNGITNNTFNWVLASAAPTGAFRQPALPVVNGVQEGDVLEFRILTVNGQPDQGLTENILQVPMTDEKGDAGSYQVQVKVLADDNPGETSWKIKDALGATVAQSPVYTEAGVLRETALTLTADQCYNFEVYDSGGDGFGDTRELGYAKVVSLGEEVAAVSGDFASLFREGVQTGTDNGCVPTQLTSTADPVISCGAMGLILGTSAIHAVAVPGANKYQFRFTNITGQPAYSRNIISSSRSLTLLKWSTLPLKAGRTYNVQVHGSFDNGATWCDYGSSCTIRIGYGIMSGGQDRMLADEGVDEALVFSVFPNPSSDGMFNLTAQGMDAEEPVTLEVFDLLGSRIDRVQVQPAEEGVALPLRSEPLGTGVYLLRISVGESVSTQRLVVR